MKSVKNTFPEYRRLLIWVAGILLLYTLIGFFLLPWLTERQLLKTLNKRLGIEATVEKIHFNPYTFEVTIDMLHLANEQDEPLAAWDRLYLNLQPLQLLQLKLRIDEITFDAPELHFRRYSTSDNTLTRLTDRWKATTKDEVVVENMEQEEASRQDEPLFVLEIGEFNYSNGEITYRDDVPATRFETILKPIDIHLDHFSTAAGQMASKDLVIALENDSRLSLNGNIVFSPLQFSGQVNLQNFSLQTPYRYLQAQLPFELKQGRLGLAFAYDIDLVDTANVELSEITLDLSGFSLHQPGESAALLQSGVLKAKNGYFIFPDNQLSIGDVVLNDFKLAASQNSVGELNWLQLFEPLLSGNTDGEPIEGEVQQLQLNIANIEVVNTELTLEDQTPAIPANLTLMLSAEMQDFSLSDDQQMPFKTNISLASGGVITVQGLLQLFPALAVQVDTDIEQMSLLPVQPYLSEFAYIEMVSGKIDSIASFTIDQQEPLGIQGNLTLSTLQLDNQLLEEKLLGIDTLAVNSFDFSLAGQRTAISEIVIDALYSRVLINENGETNLALLMKDPPKTENIDADMRGAGDATGYEFALGRVKINNASSRFTDQNLPIVFDAQMQNLNGEISGFSTRSKQPVDIALEGQVDEYGMVVIEGAINPRNVTDQTVINLAFSNLDLPAMSPYTVKFAGRRIAEGKGDIDLSYEIVESELTASNNIVIRDIRLGERVESPDAMDLPLDLTVGLLKNSDGVIELNIPVSGNVNDPQFAMGPVIRGAIGNALKNIVTAPFRFLGSLIGLGNDDEAIDEIRFRAGRADLAPPEQEKLHKLVEALSQRPQLTLQIPAPFDEAADGQRLRVTAVETRIESRLDDTESTQQRDEKRQQVLEDLYRQAGLSPDLQTLQQEFSASAEGEEQTEPQRDMLAYNAALKERLIEAEPVTVDQLQSLAEQRQQTVVAFIKQSAELNDDQLQTTDNFSTKVDDGWLSMKFDLDTL
ncbi:DUF748 domain-containing protein [Methylophaga nitratireducenticrescens]|uniref:DUF748 domain-containing protein n=1 Tax=Methylophaga nitratireducenticrescens TaxID=754476 RepID=UPI000CDCB2A3|nr:DUF748 domain-containing protein [Methylophaga nitratireducenticrescens]AUZ83405.1 hypothetical protein CDW43_01910 [Methylophaga nitratireducenticrescens]